MRSIMHIDFNSYFATVEQQANPHLRGKPIGVTGGDRMPASTRVERGEKRTVLGAASVEAKKFGVKTGMQIWEAKKLCPNIILVPGDPDKYLETTKRFLNILKDYSPFLEVFSIDEAFLEVSKEEKVSNVSKASNTSDAFTTFDTFEKIANDIKKRIKSEIGEYITCSIGISYNKLMAKLAGSLQKPDGLVVIPNQQEAIKVLDRIELDEICGIGPRIKKRLFNLGITNFKQLRAVPLEVLLASFKSYGQILYNSSRGIDYSKVTPFYEKEEVKSIGHRHTISHDTNDSTEIKQILLKLTELIGRRLRAKKLAGKTVSCWYRSALDLRCNLRGCKLDFEGGGMQTTINFTDDGLDIFKAAWKIFYQIWGTEQIRMIGASISNLKPQNPQNLTFLEDKLKEQKIIQAIDRINNKYGEFTLQRGILLQSAKLIRKPNPFLADRRFKL